MFRVLLFSLFVYAQNSISHGYGEQHNFYVGCLEKSLPEGRASIIDLLDGLVQNCHYPVWDYAEFITNYSLLADSTLSNFEREGIKGVIAPYQRRLGPLHTHYIYLIEQILLESTDFNVAFEKLHWLYDEASANLCGLSNSDIAVLAAIDIAAHSSLYWGSREIPDPATPSIKKAKWWHVVLADVAGGVVGGLFGGAAGAVGLGSACSGYVSKL